jgi:tetratricopeptide (TPR) repeat protein
VAETTAAAATLRFLRACYERHVNQDRVVPALEAVVPIAERLRASHPEEPDAHFLSASLLRRSGRLDEALPVAKQAFEARPSWLTATGVALVLRAKKETEDAIEWYERALEFEADDLTARLDVADMLFEEAWELGRAVQAYEDLLRRQPGHPWAEPSAAAARALLTGREKWRARLLAIRAADPANARAQHLQEGLARTSQPYESYLPEPQEATASLGRRFVSSEEAVGGLLKIGVSHLEAPSCVQSVSQELQRRFGGISVAIQVKKIPSPDPRAPASGAKSLLWRYEETTPIAVPAPPEPTVANAIGRIASTRYDRDAWEREARETVPGLTSGALRSLIAVMVHPPPAPDGMAAWDWWRQVQFAASLVLAHFDVGVLRAWRRPGWKALVSIARGPIDWTTEAAIVGLATVARRDPDSEARVLEIYRELLARVPDEGYSCYSRCLVRSGMQLPSVSEQERDRLEEWAIARD